VLTITGKARLTKGAKAERSQAPIAASEEAPAANKQRTSTPKGGAAMTAESKKHKKGENFTQ
jgi:hypothetical protein